MPETIEKLLSANDCGETGTHQAGICVPKPVVKLDFFPFLDPEELNPRTSVSMVDQADVPWSFEYIYYNNRLHGRGTRNEYRITWMTRYFRQYNLKSGDTVIFTKDQEVLRISFRRAAQVAPVAVGGNGDGKARLKLSGGWKVVEADF